MIDQKALEAERERYLELQRTTAARGIIREAMAVRGETPGLMDQTSTWLMDLAPEQSIAMQDAAGLLVE